MLFKVRLLGLSAGFGVLMELMPINIQSAQELPPPEETPEQVLRTEIITEARSPVDGKPISAPDYAELQAQLQQRQVTPSLSPQVRQNISLLRLRRLIRTVLPFLPI